MTNRAEKAERERDAAVARTEQAERAVNKWRTSTESAHSDFLQAAHERDEWKARAEAAEARTAVTRENVEKVVHGSGGGFFDSRLDEITDAVCALFGIESTVDPVEAKAQELWEVAKPSANATWSGTSGLAKEQFRKVAAHVLGQEAER